MTMMRYPKIRAQRWTST